MSFRCANLHTGSRAGVLAALCAIVGIVAVGSVTPAKGETRIVEPKRQPVDVRYDVNGQPIPFTIKVAGFAPFTPVYIMQCDGVPWSDDKWKPTLDCDVGSAPAPAIAGGDGGAVFDVKDPNRVMKLFRGRSPQEQFNCLAPGDPSPKNALRDFRDCSLRVSTNNLERTADQVRLALRFPPSSVASGSHRSRSKMSVWLMIPVIAVVLVIVTGVFARRSRSRAARKLNATVPLVARRE